MTSSMRHEQIVEVFDREFLDRHAGRATESPAPIFIVGLPRSGSTLVEQILASHSQVEGTQELPTLSRLAASIGRYRRDRKQYPMPCCDLRGKGFPRVRPTVRRRGSGVSLRPKARFTDKLPNNFSHVGLIHLILPTAKIINARRHPFDSCLGALQAAVRQGPGFHV